MATLPVGKWLDGRDAPLMDAGMDSLSAVEFRNLLQSKVEGVRLPGTLVFDYPSVNAILGFLERELGEPVTIQDPALPCFVICNYLPDDFSEPLKFSDFLKVKKLGGNTNNK